MLKAPGSVRLRGSCASQFARPESYPEKTESTRRPWSHSRRSAAQGGLRAPARRQSARAQLRHGHELRPRTDHHQRRRSRVRRRDVGKQNRCRVAASAGRDLLGSSLDSVNKEVSAKTLTDMRDFAKSLAIPTVSYCLWWCTWRSMCSIRATPWSFRPVQYGWTTGSGSGGRYRAAARLGARDHRRRATGHPPSLQACARRVGGRVVLDPRARSAPRSISTLLMMLGRFAGR